MSPPVFSIAGEEEGKSNVTLLVSSSAMECAHMESSELKVRNYMEFLMRNLFSPAKAAVLGNKRGFLDVMNGFQKGNFLSNSEVNTILSPRPSSKTWFSA
ncbi:hypothetical protein Ahy_B04g071717 isoform K [Arachis hypogaea]|uniref:Uncharacterized protein n=1 Tax=Arachis hypogaea TaxID=3818 RepID=A0A444ZLD7_ARAHY|nr:hypothetical protein Ahy_B04g071717 isoform K [Arachis hypogaea]